MTNKPTRYVAEIELPDGFASIDCEVNSGGKNKVYFHLNQSTLPADSHKTSVFREELFKNSELYIEVETKDILTFLNDLFKNEFSGYSDISITEVDTD